AQIGHDLPLLFHWWDGNANRSRRWLIDRLVRGPDHQEVELRTHRAEDVKQVLRDQAWSTNPVPEVLARSHRPRHDARETNGCGSRQDHCSCRQKLGRGFPETERANQTLRFSKVCSGAVSELPHVGQDRKSTRLNSSHVSISYAVFCLKKKSN